MVGRDPDRPAETIGHFPATGHTTAYNVLSKPDGEGNRIFCKPSFAPVRLWTRVTQVPSARQSISGYALARQGVFGDLVSEFAGFGLGLSWLFLRKPSLSSNLG